MFTKKKRPGKLPMTLMILATAIFLLAFNLGTGPIVPPANAKNSCSNINAPVVNAWFESGTATLNGPVKPANSVTFPNIPNCSFYAWSEQMFLWLTSPAPRRYGSSGLIFNSPAFYDVSPPDANNERTFIKHESGKIRVFNMRAAQLGPHRLPITFEKKTGRMLEIEKTPVSAKGLPLILNAEGKQTEISQVTLDAAKRPVFKDMAGKQIIKPRLMLSNALISNKAVVHKFLIDKKPIFLDAAGNVIEVEEGQAGGGDVLVSQNGSLVFYGICVNQVYAYFLTAQKNGAIAANAKFPTTQADLNAVTAYATAHGTTIIDPEALAIEVKTSWVEATSVPDPANYIRMKATVPTYDKSNPNQWVPNGQQTIELAMVGMHVVGSTKGHPEMLWATFEHINNTPDAAYSYTNNANVNTPVAQNTSGSWTFCAANSAGPFNNSHQFVDPSNGNIIANPGFVVGPSNTIRWKAWGNGGTNSAFNSEVISGNNNVRSVLIAGDPRANYIHTGTTWTIGGAAPNAGNQVGTSHLANTTMETYMQGTSNSATNGTNCFSCHTSNTPSVSHVYDPLKPLFP